MMTSVLKKSHGVKSKSMQDDILNKGGYFATPLEGKSEDGERLMKYINDNVIGKNSTFLGPFGRRKVVFCDYSSSGRSLQFLEDFIQQNILPAHGVCQSTCSHTAVQTALYRQDAISLVRSSCRCGPSDRVLLGGGGARLVRALKLRAPIILHAPNESERALAAWRDIGATIVPVSETKEGFLDLADLEQKLSQHSRSGKRLVGWFPSASRCTGALADTVAATLVLHQYGALAVWDHAHAGGAPLDMNPALPGVEASAVQKDAALLPCSVLPGGAQAPSIIILKRTALKSTGIFNDEAQDLIDKEDECGAVETVRAGLVLQLKEAIGQHAISSRTDHITRQVLAHIKNIPSLVLLGSSVPCGRQLPVFSLLVRHPRGAFLHHNFVCRVLNDVFGVQACGGMGSAQDYGQDMLGIDDNLAREYAKLLGDDTKKGFDIHKTRKLSTETQTPFSNEHLRPGFFRLSLPFFISEAELAFVLEALKMVATEAWRLLPQYKVEPTTGRWIHRTHADLQDRRRLLNVSYSDGVMKFDELETTGPCPQTFYECLQAARNLFNGARKSAQRYPLIEQDIKFNARADYLRWYMLPKEAQELLLGNSANVKHIVPFDPEIFGSGRKSVSSLHSGSSSPIPGGSPRHYSLSAIDSNQLLMFNAKYRSLHRESSLLEQPLIKPQAIRVEKVQTPPVQFAVGEAVNVSPFFNATVSNIKNEEVVMARTRCHSLGSDSPPLNQPTTRLSLRENSTITKLKMCNCGSQTDLQSLEDLCNSPSSGYYIQKESICASNSDCSQTGRASPTASIASQNSEDLQAYVKEMTREIATEIKSEIREVISRVEDVLENTEPVDYSSMTFNNNNNACQSLDSVSISDVAEYLMGVSREMASEVKHEIREMVNQVDEMISPDINTAGVNFYLASPGNSRKNSPPEMIRRRYRSGSEASFTSRFKNNLGNESPVPLRKSPTSPVLINPIRTLEEEETVFFRGQQKIGQQSASPVHSPNSLPLDASCTGSLSFNSSETSSPDTIIQVLTSTAISSNPIGALPKSSSAHKLSDEDNSCTESECQRLYCKSKTWYHNNSVSSQDSGINMSFHEHDGYHEIVKRRPSSESSCYRRKRGQTRLKGPLHHHRSDKATSEVPDIIEGVPVCSEDYRQSAALHRRAQHEEMMAKQQMAAGRMEYQGERKDSRSSCSTTDSLPFKRSSRSSNASSTDSGDFSRKSSYSSDSYGSKKSSLNTSTDDYARCSDPSCCQLLDSAADAPTLTLGSCPRSRHSSHSSSDGDYPGDMIFEEDGKWHCPPKSVWKGTVEAVQEFGMIRHQDKILVCLSGGAHSLALLHTLHQYQFYARAKGIHFSIGAVTIQDGSSEVDPLHLMAYCKTLGIKYIYKDSSDNTTCSVSRKVTRELDLCSFTNHWTRRQIYKAAAEHGYNVIATGQHLDDVAQSFIISVFNNGRLTTMKAHYYIRELNLRVIRPLIYVREKSLSQFVESRHLPTFRSPHRMPDPEEAQQGVDRSCRGVFLEDEEHLEKPEVEKECHSAPEREKSTPNSKVNRSLSAPSGLRPAPPAGVGRSRAASAPCGPPPQSLLARQEALQPGLFNSLKAALHPLISSRNIEKDMKEYRHRKRSVIQMKNGAPVYNSDEGTDEEPVA